MNLNPYETPNSNDEDLRKGRWLFIAVSLVYLAPIWLLSVLLVMAAARELAFLENEWLAWPPGDISRQWLTQFVAGTVSILLSIAAVFFAARSKSKTAFSFAIVGAAILLCYIL